MQPTDFLMQRAGITVRCTYVWHVEVSATVVDPGFSPGDAPTPKIAIIFQIFAKNCMKMKEFGPGGMHPWHPP